MKKIAKYLIILSLIIPFSFIFSGCKSNNAAANNIMTLSVNPEVSFVLDSKNKISSVNFLNEDAEILYADVDFVGKDVKSTIQIFIERAFISGHIELNEIENDFKIEIIGTKDEKIEELMTTSKLKVEEIFKTFGAKVKVKTEKYSGSICHQVLLSKAKPLAPEKTLNEIENMSNEQLIELIDEKQKEFKDLTYKQINEIKEEFNSATNPFLVNIQEIRDSIDLTNNLISNLIQQFGDNITEIIKSQIENHQQKILIYEQQINQNINKYLNEKKDKINELKLHSHELKEKAEIEFKTQVETSKENLINHLTTSKENGTITQEQYDYYVQLIDGKIEKE